MSGKPITANYKKRKPKKTKHDIDLIHARQLDILERYSAVYRLSPPMRLLWEVIYKSGELIQGQIRMLRERTGEVWTRYSYWRSRKKLERELGR